MSLSIQKIFTFSGHEAPVYSIEMFGENKIFTGGGDRIVTCIDLQNESAMALVNTGSTIYSLKYIIEKNILLAGVSVGGMHVIDLIAKKEIHFLVSHEKGIFDIRYSLKHKLIFTAGGDGKVSIWSMENFSFVKSIQICPEKVRSIAIDNEENLLIISGGDGYINVLEINNLKLINKFKAHQSSVNSITIHPYLNILISGGKDAYLNFWTLNGFEQILSVPAHNYAIYSISFSPDYKFFATGSRDKTVKIWNGESFEFQMRIDLEKFKGHKHSVNKVLWHNEMLLSASDDRSIVGWKISEE